MCLKDETEEAFADGAKTLNINLIAEIKPKVCV
jgi:hypothetical protein